MANLAKANFGSPIDGDKVIETLTGTFTYTYTTNDNGGIFSVPNPQPGTKFLPLTYFSVDGGSTWFGDMEGDVFNDLIDFLTGVTESSINYRWNYYGPAGSKTVMYRTALLLIEDIDNTDKADDPVASFSKVKDNLNLEAYDSGLNYQRIVLSKAYSIAKNTSRTIRHGLSYIPYYRVWAEMRSGEVSYFFAGSAQYTFTNYFSVNGIYGFGINADSANINIDSFSPTRPFYLRVYEG